MSDTMDAAEIISRLNTFYACHLCHDQGRTGTIALRAQDASAPDPAPMVFVCDCCGSNWNQQGKLIALGGPDDD